MTFPSEKISAVFRRSSAARSLLLIAGALLVFCAILSVRRATRSVPVISEISPPDGRPGDIVAIRGSGFGAERGESFVEFGGSILTASAYLSWSDEKIAARVPDDLRGGLVAVTVKGKRSKASFFSDIDAVPKPVPENEESLLPSITSISPDTAEVGQAVSIFGTNFGSSYGASSVFFTAAWNDGSARPDDGGEGNFIKASREEFDCEYWSDTEIRTRVPDGAASGPVRVETAKGKSEAARITVGGRAGSKKFKNKTTWLIQLSADIDDISVDSPSSIRLYFPRPVLSSAQSEASMTESNPPPTIENHQNSSVYQLEVDKGSAQGKKRFQENFVVTTREVNTTVNESLVPQSYSGMSAQLFELATQADSVVPSSDARVASLSRAIIGKETNPFKKARLVYNYMTENFTLSKNASDTPLEPRALLRLKKGDAYDIAILYTALLRAAGVPALPDCGVAIDRAMKTKPHWWSEFYILGAGWIPVDVAMGMGMEGAENPREYYFGNIDSRRVVFSRGANQIKHGAGSASVARRPKSYALQSVWEESSRGVKRYSSFWADPAALGAY